MERTRLRRVGSAICFAANIAFIALEFALATLEWGFAAMGNLVSG